MTDGLVLDLFAGPGGWDEGMASLGIRNVIGVETDRWACATAVAAGHRRFPADVSALHPAAFGPVWGFVASPPCTTFSMAGHGAGRRLTAVLFKALDDVAAGRSTIAARRREAVRILRAHMLTTSPGMTRAERGRAARKAAVTSMLVVEPLRYIRDLRPEWVALEQVPAVLPLWRHIAHILRGWGYSAWTAVLNAADYGVPQTRQRAILGASRVRKVGPPAATHAKDPGDGGLFGDVLAPWVSMAEALGWTGNVVGSQNSRIGGGQTRRPTRETDLPSPTVLGTVDRWSLHTNRDQRADGSRQTASVDEPAPAFTSKSGGQWVLKSRRDGPGWVDEHGAHADRDGDDCAPTLIGEAFRWSLRNGSQENACERRACERRACEPAGALFFGGRSNWVGWVRERPATTVQGDPRVGRPGHKNRDRGEQMFGEDSVRITVTEAAVLQSFRPDYPWQGTKTQQFQQVGNAIPPLLAAHVVAAVTGLTIPTAADIAA